MTAGLPSAARGATIFSIAIAGEAASGGIHLPDQSWYPLVAAAGLLTAGLCFAHDNFVGAIAGGAILFAGIYLWSLEGPGGYHVHPETLADAASH